MAISCRPLRSLVNPGATARGAAAGRPVLAVTFDSSGRFALGACHKLVRLWNASTGTLVQTFGDATGYEVTAVAPTRDGERLVSCAGRAAVLWDVATAAAVRRFASHDQRVNCAAFAGDSLLATGAYDQQVRLFDLRQTAHAPAQVLRGARDSVSAVFWPRGSCQLVASSVDGKVRTYDVRRGTVAVDDVGAPVSSVCATNDGECVLSSCLDSCLRLLDRESGELLITYSGHVNREYKLECGVLFDDSAVCCGSEDGYLCLWDLAGASEPARKFGGGGDGGGGGGGGASPLCALATHPTEGIVMTGSHGGDVNLYEVGATGDVQMHAAADAHALD
jgi:mitogen-activated protein kinase organizer 1